MKSLCDTVKDYIASLKPGDRLKYITGQNTLEVVSVAEGGESITINREATGGSVSEITINIGAIKDVLDELEGGEPVHFETFFHGGGNVRSVYETLIAHSPRISWCKINNQKHLRSHKHKVHPPNRLWRSDGGDWSSPEWALATVIYADVVKQKKRCHNACPYS